MTHMKYDSRLHFFLSLAEAHAKIVHVFDRRLGGLGFSDFVLLYHLHEAEGEKMRRVDLAEKMGMTASGITRMLLPMEKIGWIKREESKEDARVSFVKLAPGGKRLFSEAIERAELVAEELLPSTDICKKKDINDIFDLLSLGRIIS